MNSTPSGIKKLYYSIGEVSDITGIKPYVLRYWQTEFKQLNPPKNRAGNRTYRQKDIDLILSIKSLLYEQKFTIEGARHKLETEGVTPGFPSESGGNKPKEVSGEFITSLRDGLKEILQIIRE